MTAPTFAARRRTRLAVLLGAAVAIAATALLGTDMPASFAEDGFFGMLFSDAPHRRVVEPLSYHRGGYYGRHAPRRRAAHFRRHRHYALRHASRFARRAGVSARFAAEGSRRGAGAYLRRRLAHRGEASAAVIVAATAPAAASGRRIFCVRSCDAAYFPAPTGPAAFAGPKSQQKACRQACPGAATQVFTLSAGATRMKEAVSATDGRLYADLVAQIGGAAQNAPGCSCGSAADAEISRPARAFAAMTTPPAQSALAAAGGSAAYLDDPTLRPGDTVVTPQGVRVVRAGSHYPFKRGDFLSLAETREVSTEKRGALAAIERVLKTPHGRALGSLGSRRD